MSRKLPKRLAQAQLASPQMVTDLIEDSRSRMDVCDRCDGLGTVAAPPHLDPAQVPGYKLLVEAIGDMDAIYSRTCPGCLGEGKVRRPGDAHARDRLVKMAGLEENAKGASVVVNFGGASHSAAISFLEDAMSIDAPAQPSVVDPHAEDLE